MKIFKVSQNLQFVKTPEDLNDRETSRAIRDALINEQLAIQQYEAIVDGTSDDKVKEVLQDIADEERVHVGELLALLELSSEEEAVFLEEGSKEVKTAASHDDILEDLKKFMKGVDKTGGYVTPEDFAKEKHSDYYILDIRKPADFKSGHIKGAHNIFWKDLLQDHSLSSLPDDKTILLVCYVGHTASQMLVVLSLLGYKVKVLKFGMGQSPVEGVPVAGWLDYGFDVKSGEE